MKRNWIVIVMTSLLLLSFGQANASVITAVANPSINDTTIQKGTPFLLEIWMYNDWGGMDGGSFPWAMYSPDQSITSITHRVVDTTVDTGYVYSAQTSDWPPDSLNDSSILMYNGFDESKWEMIFAWTGWSWDGTLPDTINFSGISMTGWQQDTDTTLYMAFALQIDEDGIFCIDSIDHPNDVYDWLFDDPNVHFNGPYCWNVSGGSDVREFDGLPLPVDFNLGQNYPNPFNMSTVIEFSVPQRSTVTLSIFNILGQKIKTLVDSDYEAGHYCTNWDGTADNGTIVASGIYFYKIQAGQFRSTKKLMMLK